MLLDDDSQVGCEDMDLSQTTNRAIVLSESRLRYVNVISQRMEHRGVRRLSPGSNGIVILTASTSREVHDDISSLVKEMGAASSRAQGLPHVITTFNSFVNSDNTMYILIDDTRRKALGFVKVGVRNLFLWDRRGIQHERKGLCLLDFFTCPECQRQGYGKRMIDAMLSHQGLEMRHIPIDRPSTLCLRFMKKYFGFSEYVNQSNHFVVFDDFWGDDGTSRKALLPITNNAIKTNPLNSNGLKAVIANPVKRTRFNPITWSVHPGVDH
jgi:alpha-tubulin N-acetyltransferase 1